MKKGYCWLHIPTGTAGVRTFEELYKGHLEQMCAKWNRQGAGMWQYWVL